MQRSIIGADLFVIVDDLYEGKRIVKPTVLFAVDEEGKAHEKTVYGGAAVIDGVISSVFKDTSYACSKNINALAMLMPILMDSGGNKLVCRGELLEKYMAFGFVPIAHAVPGIVGGEYSPEKFYMFKSKEHEEIPQNISKFENYGEALGYLKNFAPKKKTLSFAANRSHFLDEIYLS